MTEGAPAPEAQEVSAVVAALVRSSVAAAVDALQGDLDPAVAAAITARVEPLQLPAGDVLFAQGDRADGLYFVVTGRLLVSEEHHSVNVPLRHLGPGEILGEMGLIEGNARTASVRASRDSVLGRLPSVDFDELVADHPDLLRRISAITVRRLTRPRPPVDRVRTVAIAVADPSIDTRVFLSRLQQEVARHGETTLVSRAMVDARLGPGVADSDEFTADGVRLDELLDTIEAKSEFVLLEAAGPRDTWSRRALRRADRILVVVPADPDEEAQAKAIQAFDLAADAGEHERWLLVARPKDDTRPHGTAAILERLGADRALHARVGSAADTARVARLMTGTATGLVLGGGGARGLAHIGVYRALQEAGVAVDAVAGSSIGAILAAGIARGMTAEEVLDVSGRHFRKVLDYTLPLVSLVRGAKITKGIEAEFAGVDIEDLVLPFVCISTNLTKSRPQVHARGPVTPALRAGCAIPGVIPPVPFEGDLLVDAGVIDNMPIVALQDTGLVGTVIAVDVAPPMGPKAPDEYGLSVSGWAALRAKVSRRRRYPRITALILRSMLVGSMQERNRLADADYADLYLDLDVRGIPLLAFDEVDAAADAGYQLAAPRIQEWLGNGTSGGSL